MVNKGHMRWRSEPGVGRADKQQTRGSKERNVLVEFSDLEGVSTEEKYK